MPPRLSISFRVEKILPKDTGPLATSLSDPLIVSVPLGRSFDRWIATPAPFRRAWLANLQLASIPSGPSIESSTTKTVQDTGSRDSGLSSHDCTRPVREIYEVVI
ncbi:MAG: hypothetical protein VXA09_05005 [Burkholderiaceae bacterium]